MSVEVVIVKLQIWEIEDVTITKVKDWAIDFQYDSTRYLLKGSSEVGEGSWATLYEKQVYDLGKYKLRQLCVKSAPEYVGEDFIRSRISSTPTLSQLDVFYFVYKLTEYGFVDSIYTDYVVMMSDLLSELDRLNSAVSGIQGDIHRIQKRIREGEFLFPAHG